MNVKMMVGLHAVVLWMGAMDGLTDMAGSGEICSSFGSMHTRGMHAHNKK